MSRKSSGNIVLMICIDMLLVAMTVFLGIFYHSFGQGWMLSAYVTSLTISYHFIQMGDDKRTLGEYLDKKR